MDTLSDKIAHAARPRDAQYKLGDPQTTGLFLLVKPNGVKEWRTRVKKDGRETQSVLGKFPEMKISQARTLAGSHRVGEKGVTFEEAAQDWLEWNSARWAPVTRRVIEQRLKHHAYPKFAKRSLLAIGTPDIMSVVEGLRKAGKHETAKRIVQYCEQVFALANARHGYEHNPASQASLVRLPRPPAQHHPAPTLAQLGELLDYLDGYRSRTTARLFEFTILTACRKSEAGKADWREFSDLGSPERALWTVPADRTKMRRPHTVPLSGRAVELLREQADGAWPKSGLVFPHPSGKPLSENALLEVLYKRGLKGVYDVHGMRSAFATWAANAGHPLDVIDACLSHRVGGPVSSIYNRAQYDAGKREVLEAWAGELARRKSRAALL